MYAPNNCLYTKGKIYCGPANIFGDWQYSLVQSSYWSLKIRTFSYLIFDVIRFSPLRFSHFFWVNVCWVFNCGHQNYRHTNRAIFWLFFPIQNLAFFMTVYFPILLGGVRVSNWLRLRHFIIVYQIFKSKQN